MLRKRILENLSDNSVLPLALDPLVTMVLFLYVTNEIIINLYFSQLPIDGLKPTTLYRFSIVSYIGEEVSEVGTITQYTGCFLMFS